MSDQTIRKDFVEGTYEIFTTLFNEGAENDGITLYRLVPSTPNIYGENKYKSYKTPVNLVCSVKTKPEFGENEISEIKEDIRFKVPLKSLQDNDLDVSTEGLEDLRNCMIKFHDTFYEVLNISPTTYVEDVFLFYTFECIESKTITEVSVDVD